MVRYFFKKDLRKMPRINKKSLILIISLLGIIHAENLTDTLQPSNNKDTQIATREGKMRDLDSSDTVSLIPYSKSFFTILGDNDAYVDPYVDHYYTVGTKFEYTTREFDFSQSWARYLSLNGASHHLSRLSFGLRQDIYTPIKRGYRPDSNDYPYSGYLVLESSIANRRKNSLEVIQMQIGIIGPDALGKQTQDLVHKLTGNPIFLGWDTQLKNEFALNFSYDFIYRYTLLHSEKLAGFSIDVLPTTSVALGNISAYVDAGARMRFGWNLDNDFGTPKINTSSIGSLPYSNRFSFYIFGGFVGRYVIRDAFIQGNSFDSRDIQIENFIYNAEVGASISYRGFSFSYVITQISREFKGALPYHNIGSLVISFAF